MAEFCPTIDNICVVRGNSPIIPVEIRDPSTGQLIDITGYSFVLTVDTKKNPTDATNRVFQVSVPALSDGSSGVVQIPISAANTDQSPGDYFYEVVMTTTAPSIRSVLAGRFRVQQSIP